MGFRSRLHDLLTWVAYVHVNPLLNAGLKGEIGEDSAREFLLEEDRAEVLHSKFRGAYEELEVRSGVGDVPKVPLCVCVWMYLVWEWGVGK